MNKFTIFLIFGFVLTLGQAYELVEDEQGDQYYLVPISLHRQRRQTTIGAVPGANGGTRVTVGHQGTIFENNGHRLDGGASYSREFRPTGPVTVGGNLAYSHTPSGSGLNVGAQNTRGYGTDLSATGTANIWRQGNSRLDAVGSYDRHYGGPGGTGKPSYYGGLQFNHRF